MKFLYRHLVVEDKTEMVHKRLTFPETWARRGAILLMRLSLEALAKRNLR